MRVNHISMYFRHHNIEIKADDISKLNFRIRANDCFLAELHVKTPCPPVALLIVYDPSTNNIMKTVIQIKVFIISFKKGGEGEMYFRLGDPNHDISPCECMPSSRLMVFCTGENVAMGKSSLQSSTLWK